MQVRLSSRPSCYWWSNLGSVASNATDGVFSKGSIRRLSISERDLNILEKIWERLC